MAEMSQVSRDLNHWVERRHIREGAEGEESEAIAHVRGRGNGGIVDFPGGTVFQNAMDQSKLRSLIENGKQKI